MLSPILSTGLAVFCVLLVGFAVISYVWMARLAAYCRTAVEFVLNSNKNAVGLRRLTDLETSLTELTDSYDSLITSHKKLRSRIGMRKLREKPDAGSSEAMYENMPDPRNDPAGYKRAMRLQLRRDGVIK